jgi:hypothetical protein
LGDISVDGWLSEHSRAYRYFLAYRNAIDTDASPSPFDAVRPDGYLPALNSPLRGSDQAAIGERLLQAQFSAAALAPEQLRAFGDLLALRTDARAIAVLEMPAHPRHWPLLQATSGYAALLSRMQAAASAHGTPFWPTMPRNLVAEAGWADSIHLNRRGAQVLTRWLAGQVAEAVVSGEIAAPRESAP